MTKTAKRVRCSYCSGTGRYKSPDTGNVQCPVCNGQGYSTIYGADAGCLGLVLWTSAGAATAIVYGLSSMFT